VVDSILGSNSRCAIATAVVDDEPLHDIKPWHLTRQGKQSFPERTLFVVTGDLDDELAHQKSHSESIGGRRNLFD
jgi:hypothetical protein